MDCGYGAYVDLMKRYPLVTDAFLQLKPGYQKACLRPQLLCIANAVCHSTPSFLLLQPFYILVHRVQVKVLYFLRPAWRDSVIACCCHSVLQTPCGGNGAHGR